MKNEKGFTLVEVIISIAALGVICAVLLRLFMLAGDTNDLTANRQAAEMAAASVAETVLCADTLQDGVDALGASPAEAGGQFMAVKGGYEISLRFTPSGENYPGMLYDVCIQALKEGNVVTEINTAKYYPEESHD